MLLSFGEIKKRPPISHHQAIISFLRELVPKRQVETCARATTDESHDDVSSIVQSVCVTGTKMWQWGKKTVRLIIITSDHL